MEIHANKVAVVTGGSRGIGRAAADRLAADGLDIVLVSRSETDLRATAEAIRCASGRSVAHVAADLRELDEVRRAAALARDSFGRVDVLVNAAGATRGGSFLELDDEVWRDGFALKFFGAVRITRELWPALRQAQGCVVNIVGGFARTPDPEFLIGGAVNAAFANFSKGLSKLGIRDGVRVNAIHPGTTDTDRLRDIVRTRARSENVSEDEIRKSMAAREKIAKLGTPEDVANLVSFLCNPASRHIQGTSIAVDGGATQSVF